MSTRIVLASGNQGKLRELQQLLQQLDVELLTQGSLGIEDAEETGLTFIENAILKARHASNLSGLPALSDDSGLAVDALGGAPGIYSARFSDQQQESAERAARDTANNQKLLGLLDGVPDSKRTAQFHCVLVFLRHAADPTPIVCHGVWEGRILHSLAGEGGFGYDPLFYVPSLDCSSAQLRAEQKNVISHRALAMQSLLRQLPSRL